MNIERKPSTDDMSVEEILKSIKEVINNCNQTIESPTSEDILELTNIVANKHETEKISKQTTMVNGLDNLSHQILQQTFVEAQLPEQASTHILQNFAKIAAAEPGVTSNCKVKILEDLVIELLRPQLSQWLDKNLQFLVRQLIEKEIQRLMPPNSK